MMRNRILFSVAAVTVALGAALMVRAGWDTVADGVAMQSAMLSDRAEPARLEPSTREPIRFAGAYSAGDPVDQSRLASGTGVDPIELASAKDTVRVVLTEDNGDVVFDMDPSTNTTVLGRGAVIPSIHVRRGDDAGVDVMVVENPAIGRARRVLAERLESGERLDANIFDRADLVGIGTVVR